METDGLKCDGQTDAGAPAGAAMFIGHSEKRIEKFLLTDVTVDLDASDTFPESVAIEGTITGSYERVAPAWQKTSQFNFHFIATFLGDNTAEVELSDGTVFTVQLDSKLVQNLE